MSSSLRAPGGRIRPGHTEHGLIIFLHARFALSLSPETGRDIVRERGASGTDTNPVGATVQAVTIGTTARGVIVIEAERGKSHGHQ